MHFERRLLKRDEIGSILQLSSEQVDQLIATDQLRTIRICGEERLDSRELWQFVDSYRAIQERKQ